MNDFSYEFSPLTDTLAMVTRIDHHTKEVITFEAMLADDDILRQAGRQVTSVVADLMDIGGAVLIADYFSPRRQHQCTINIKLPVRNLDLFLRPTVMEAIQSALHHFTHDRWNFEFIPHNGTRRIAERQHRIFARTEEEQDVHVALFSGGADALGGLAHQLVDNPNTFFSLVSVGTDNRRMQNIQSTLFQQLRRTQHGDRLQHIFINTSRRYHDSINPNKDFRARAFVFLLIGCAFALLEGQDTLYVYENGIGAINLPFRASEVGLDHSRTVHPASLERVSNFVSEVVRQEFCIRNPFFFHTKVEVCNGLIRAGIPDLMLQTVTCDRIGRNTYQCGTCSSCILRRQAMYVINTPDMRIPDTHYSMDRNSTHLCHMRYQVEYLREILDSENTWNLLARKYPTFVMDLDNVHCSLGLSKPELHEEVVAMYERYVYEWYRIEEHFDTDEMLIGIDSITDDQDNQDEVNYDETNN